MAPTGWPNQLHHGEHGAHGAGFETTKLGVLRVLRGAIAWSRSRSRVSPTPSHPPRPTRRGAAPPDAPPVALLGSSGESLLDSSGTFAESAHAVDRSGKKWKAGPHRG